MSNTSNNKTTNSKSTKSKDKDKLRVIVGEIGRDSKTGILGRGYSSDNGKTFHVTDTMYGRLYDPNDIEGIWNSGTADKVKKEVDSATAEIPAVKSAADEAVKKADSAIASSKVNSDAIIAQSEAISEAKAAMDSATAEIQQTASNAASDAAKIRADLAQVQNEVDTAKASNSASVEALKSDVSAAKQDLADVHDSLTKAQAAAEESQKAIDNSIAKINSDIEQDRKDIASAQQANADTAKQLDTYSKQAQDQGKTIKSIQDKQDGFTATLADVQGNVTQVSDKVDGLSASLKDAQDNVASIKAQADQLSATLTDHAKSIATLTASAKELGSTLEDANGRLSKVEQTAQTNSSTLSDVQGDLSQVKQQADGLVTTLKDAQGSITQIQQKADGTLAQLKNAQGDIASLQTDVTGIKATLVSHEGDIHTLQADSKSLHDSMQDAQGDISTLKKTSTDVTSELKDHAGRISKTEQTASTLVNEFADQQGHLNRVEQTANGTQQTVANQQGQINNIKTDAAGIHETITGQGNQIANINVTLNGLNTKYEDVSGDLGNLKNSAMQNRGTVSAPDFNSLTAAGFYTITTPSAGKNYPTGSWGTLEVSGQVTDNNGRLNQKYVCDNGGLTFYRQYNRNTNSWTNWKQIANQDDITSLSNRITMNSTQITQNKQAIALKADQSTVDNLSGEVSQNEAQLKVQAGQIRSKVSSSDFKTLNDKVNGAISSIQKNSTAIDQTNKQISLKADQTEVNQVKGTAIKNSSRLDTMANEIKSKVTSTDVNNIVDGKGYATTSTVQSLITQKAGTINESITNLTSEMNTRNGVNLLKGTKDFSGSWHNYGSTNYWHTENWIDPNGNHSVKSDSLSWYGYFQPIYLDTGDYTFSGYYYSEGGKPVYCYIRPNSGDNLVEVSYNSNLDSTPNGWRWFVVHFKVTKAGNTAVRLESGQNQILHIASYKLERGTVANPVWTPAPSDNATVTQVQSLTASIDGLQSTVANKADKSQITQLTNVVQSKVSSKDYQTAISQLTNDINARVSKGDLMSQINIEAGRLLFQSKKIFLDADTIVFSKNSKAFIPDAAIENLSLDKLTTGHLNIPLQDKDGNSISLNSKGITVASPGASEKAGEFSHMLFNLGNGKLSLEGDLHKISSGETEHYRLGSFQATYDYLDKIGSKVDDGGKYIQQSLGMSFVIDTLDPGQTADKNGDFFALARSQYNSSNPAYVNGVLYNTTGNRREIGLHTFDPLYIHPYGADGYIQSTWVSWSNWNNGEKMPALTQAGITWGGIGFPKNGKVTLFDSDGHAFQPYGGSNYDDYQKQYHIGG